MYRLLIALAFYKGDGDITDKAIRWWTKSDYSHVELYMHGMWYSTSPRDLEVRRKMMQPKPENWDYVEVEVDYHKVIELFTRTKGAKYDWTGILLSQFIPLGRHSKSRWFCSEWCAEALGLDNSNEYSPGDLYKKVSK